MISNTNYYYLFINSTGGCVGSLTRHAIVRIKFFSSFECSPPRKSLVKGEKFYRFEREPKLSLTGV